MITEHHFKKRRTDWPRIRSNECPDRLGRLRQPLRHTVRLGIVVMFASSIAACVFSPYDGQRVATKDSVTVTGGWAVPGVDVEVEAFNFASLRWDRVGTLRSSDLPVTTNKGTGFVFADSVALNASVHWLEDHRDNGHALARIRIASGSTELLLGKPGFFDCVANAQDLRETILECTERGPAELLFGDYRRPNFWYSIDVARHESAQIIDAEVERILDDAATVVQRDDGPGDVTCGVDFFQSGVVTTFSQGDGSINSRRDFNRVLDIGADVMVVSTINWCGGIDPSIIGCAPNPGHSIVVERLPLNPEQEGMLWAHEFGHNRRLEHRDEPGALMASYLSNSARRLNPLECDAFF